ncbi:MAG TPA: sensor histidine kinase [Pyrinomonadaceae bacterium]
MTKRQARRSLFTSGNIAFAIVVCASYASGTAAIFYSHRPVTRFEAAVLLALGVAYLFVGTYGFTRVRESRSLLAGVVYFAIQLSLGTTLIRRGSTGELSLILLPLAGQTALILPIYLTVPLCLSIYTILVMPFLLRGRWIDAIALALIYGTGIVFVAVFTRVAASERDARNALAEANQLLRDHALQVEELATTKERNRLAREIHDSVGHYLTVVNVQIGAARTVLDQNRSRALEHLSKAQSLTQEGLAEVRHSVAALRASPTESRPLPEALTALVDQWQAAGLNANFRLSGIVRTLTPQTNLTLYRAGQEALTNVAKHASATTVNVRLNYGDDRIRLTIRDNGIGASESEGGFGLLGIRERVQLLNGSVRVTTDAGKGFILEVEVPE